MTKIGLCASRLALVTSLVLTPSLATAQSAPAGAGANSADIVVTGTRRAERTRTESLSPVDIVSARDLGASPSAELSDKIAASEPSFVVQRQPGFDGASYVRPAALRNLSPDQTLVLVNGHRRHRSAFVDVVNQGGEAVDLAQIPDVAVGHVEVLRDGASAQYGSDAIGGVINVLLDTAPGTTLSAQASQYYAGDGTGAQISGRTGFKTSGGGHVVVAGEYLFGDYTDRSAGVKNRIGQPHIETAHFTYDVAEPLTDAVNVYSFSTYGRSTGRLDFSFRSAQADDAVFARSFYQNGANAVFPNWSLTSLYPNGFSPTFQSITKDIEAVAGLKADLAPGLAVDVSGRYGRNEIDYGVQGSINASLGPLSPRDFDAGHIIASETAANIDATYQFAAGLAKPVSIAFGGEYLHADFRSIAGDPASYQVGALSDLPSGSYGFPGLSPVSAGRLARDSVAAYVDTEADLTSHLTIGAAGRFEHFSDFGSNFSWKIAGRYEIIPQLALRATYNTGFHAPAPGQQFFTKVTTAPDLTQAPPFPVETIALVSPTDPLAKPFGGKRLKPEISHSVSVGAVLQPIPGLTITADYYHIHIRDRIGIVPETTLPVGSAYTAIQFLINGYSTSTDGFDIVASLAKPLWGGRLGLTAAYNHNVTRITDGTPVLMSNLLHQIVEDRRPRDTATFSATYDTGPVHLMGRVRYYGAYIDALPFFQPVFPSQRISPRAFVDVNISYDITSSTRITAGAENVLSTYPDKAKNVLTFAGYQYPLTRPYEEDGGRWFVRVTQKF